LAINIIVNNQLYLYQGYTLVDITPTGVITHTDEQELERNQQRNWETIQQIISLRTQPTIVSTDNFVADIKDYNFGINYTKRHRIWTFTFSSEYQDVYADGIDVFGLLKYDFKITPIVVGLHETADFPQPIFYPNGPNNNIYFKTLAT